MSLTLAAATALGPSSQPEALRAVLAANLFLLLPLTAATYHLPLPLTARPSVHRQDRYLTPISRPWSPFR